MRMSQNQRALRKREIQVLVAVGVPDARAIAAFVKERMRLGEFAKFGRDAAREYSAGAFVEFSGFFVAFGLGIHGGNYSEVANGIQEDSSDV